MNARPPSQSNASTFSTMPSVISGSRRICTDLPMAFTLDVNTPCRRPCTQIRCSLHHQPYTHQPRFMAMKWLGVKVPCRISHDHAPSACTASYDHTPQPQYAPDGRPLSFNSTAPSINYHPSPEWQNGPRTRLLTYTSRKLHTVSPARNPFLNLAVHLQFRLHIPSVIHLRLTLFLSIIRTSLSSNSRPLTSCRNTHQGPIIHLQRLLCLLYLLRSVGRNSHRCHNPSRSGLSHI